MISDQKPMRNQMADCVDAQLKLVWNGASYDQDTEDSTVGCAGAIGAPGEVNVTFPSCFECLPQSVQVETTVTTNTTQRIGFFQNVNASAGSLKVNLYAVPALTTLTNPLTVGNVVYIFFRLKTL
jgi:hypothetical protein